MKRVIILLLAPAILSLYAGDQVEPVVDNSFAQLPVVVDLKSDAPFLKVANDPAISNLEGRQFPRVFKTEEEFKSVFGDLGTKDILTGVSFKDYYIVLFLWWGSGADQIDVSSTLKDKPVVTFTYRQGYIKSNEEHLYCFMVRRDAEFKIETR